VAGRLAGSPVSELIESAAGIESLAAELERAPDIALDTEGNSFHAHRDRVCLIQLAVGLPVPGSSPAEPRIFLVDPLAVDPRPLAPIFADPRHRLVVHGGDFDVRSLRRDFGFTFGRMFDTMLAAQTLKLPELGLVALLKRELDVTIGKGEQRSDWGKRPLRPEQLSYAGKDVRYLLPLAAKLEAQLAAADKLTLAGIQFEKLRHLVAREKIFDSQGFRHIKGARGLTRAQLEILEAAWVGRERLAVELDRAPFKIIGEQAMMEVARRGPRDLESLRKVPGVGELVVRRLGGELIAAGTAPEEPGP
jgi:ribonuclease D